LRQRFLIRESAYADLNAGLPELDIVPNNSVLAGKYYSIVYVQQVDEDHEYEVWEIDSIDEMYYEVTGGGFADHQRILPSVALHYGCIPETGRWASITMLVATNEGAPGSVYRPRATLFNLDTHQGAVGWAPISQDVTGGPWDPVFMLETDPGLSTDIVTLDEPQDPEDHVINNYYAAFCNRLDGGAGEVYAAWGNAEP
jgi:hypothetical protein